MTNTALDALRKIRALKRYPIPQTTQLAVQKILKKTLSLTDLTAVVTALEADPQGGQ
jgi:hypothetical protein